MYNDGSNALMDFIDLPLDWGSAFGADAGAPLQQTTEKLQKGF